MVARRSGDGVGSQDVVEQDITTSLGRGVVQRSLRYRLTDHLLQAHRLRAHLHFVVQPLATLSTSGADNMSQDPPVLPDGRMTARSAASYLGLTLRTLENKRSNGTGPKFVKAGKIFITATTLTNGYVHGGSAAPPS